MIEYLDRQKITLETCSPTRYLI